MIPTLPHPRPKGPRPGLPVGVSYHCAEHGRLLQRDLHFAGTQVLCNGCDQPAVLRFKFVPPTPAPARARHKTDAYYRTGPGRRGPR